MSNKMVSCKVCGEEIAKRAKRCPKCGAKNKKPIFKRFWFWLIVVALIFGAIGSCGSDTEAESVADTPSTTQAPTPTETAEATEATEAVAETFTIELIANEPGDYGELFTLNKDTEFEETYYIYRIPAGTYSVTNTGDYMSQINICSDEVHVTSDGWEEYVDIPYVKLLDVDASDTFTIADGYHVEIQEPAEFTLEMIEGNAKDTTAAEEAIVEETEENKEPSLTMGEINALASAKSYLAFTAFSYNGLIGQLEFEGYTTEEATYAADNCGANWKEQALKSAEDYLDFTAFSYEGLIDQLEYEEFTTEQATYAADNCGADWNEQAAKSAESYLDFTSFSRTGLIEQLEYEGFTHEQAVYGAEANGY